VQINLKVVGKDLYKALSTEIRHADSAFHRQFHQEAIKWDIDTLGADITPEDLVSFPGFPSVILIETRDAAFIEKIHAVERKLLTFIKQNATTPLIASPIIFVFPSADSLKDINDFPDFVSDWVISPLVMRDVAHRVLTCLKRKKILKPKLHCGSLTLIPESRSISYEDRTIRLTPSEFTLAELFLVQWGTVISMKDLVHFFESSGKSTEANNIRVAIFQLRLKLEMLTKSQIMLVSIYRQGYCMRKRNN
jgi:DNA-binding response OmpR family regulator